MPVRVVHAPLRGRGVLKPSQAELLRRDASPRAPQGVTLRRVAYHEAGHAVAYLWYGQMVEHVTILPTPEKGMAGHCTDPLATGTRLAMDKGRRVVAGLTLLSLIHI